MNILIGSASWTDPTLIACKRFYPPGTSSAEARLRYYASQFPLVEVDASYYAMPSASHAELWVERTPPDFTMNMKAFRLFTGHPAPADKLPGDIRMALRSSAGRNVFYRDLPEEIRDELRRRWHGALAPLRAARKLGAVLCQFPPWVKADTAGRALVEHCTRRMGAEEIGAGAQDAVAVEFRHRSWFEPGQRAETLAFLQERRLVNVIVDAPQGFDNSVPAVWEVTHPSLAMVRLHGRNTAAWNHDGPTSSGRFTYLYPPDEIAELAARIKDIAAVIERTHVVVNTNYEDQGPRNGRRLQRALRAGAGAA